MSALKSCILTQTQTKVMFALNPLGLSRFDFTVTVFAFLGLIALAFDMEPFYFIVVLRPLQLLRYALVFLLSKCRHIIIPTFNVLLSPRLFKIKQRYRNVLDTMFELFPRMASLGLTLIIFYYSFAIVGMEFFAGVVYPNCCKWVRLTSLLVINTHWFHLLRLVAPSGLFLLQHQHGGRLLQAAKRHPWQQNCVGGRLLLSQQLQQHSQQLRWGTQCLSWLSLETSAQRRKRVS